MKCFKYLIQQFENLTTFCRMIVWWWLVFVITPGWAEESKSVSPQNSSDSTSACQRVDDEVVEKWKEDVQKFEKLLPKMATRGGGLEEISSPLFFPITLTSSKVVNILSGQRKIHLAWEGGEKRYRVKVSITGESQNWFEKSALQVTRVSLEKKEENKLEKKEENKEENKGFKAGENHRFAVIDSNDESKVWKFTVVDRESQLFSKQLDEIQQKTSDVKKKIWFSVALLLSYGEEWKLEAYQQIAEQLYQKETDEFYLAWLGIKYQIWPTCQEGEKK